MAAAYSWDDFVLDLDAYRLERRGVPLALEPKALNLLALMVSRPHHLFTKQEIFEAIWPDTAVSDHALTRIVAQLRRTLGDEAREARYIETVPTRGYRWIRPVQTRPASASEVLEPAASQSAPPATVEASRAGAGVPAHTPPGRLRRLVPRVAAVCALAAVPAVLVWRLPAPGFDAPSRATAYDASARGADWTATPSVAWPVQVTTHDGLELQPSLSPHGDAVAYVSDKSGAFEIYVRAFGGAAAESPLTRDGRQNVQPSWSPDGGMVAYHSQTPGGIWVVPARGGIARQVARQGSNPSWSPDGRRLAFQSDEHTDVTPSAYGAQSGSTIWIVDADGSHLRQATITGAPAGGHAAPSWSPDGRWLAFTVFESGVDNGVWLLSLDTGRVTALARGQGLFEVVFAPDGRTVYATGGEALIVRIPFDPATGTAAGSRSLIPVAGVAGVRGLSMAADGSRLAFAGLTLSSQIWAQRVTTGGAAAGEPYALTSDTSRRNSMPAVSPDGTRVAYTSSRRGELPNVWVMGIDGAASRQVTRDDTPDSKPTWFPDARRVAFMSERDRMRGLWSVDVDTRHEELVVDLAAAPGSEGIRLAGRLAEIDLSPSMRQVAFTLMPPPGIRVLYVSPTSGFEPRALTNASVSAGYPAWSPDESSVAVELKDGSSTHAAVIDARTGALRQLTHERGQTWVRSWSPDGRRLATAVLRDGVWSLRWVDVVSGASGVMTAPAPPRIYYRYPDWSPRGDVVAFERGELKGNIWTIGVE